MAGQMKFFIIKTKEQGMFISDNIEIKDYFSSQIPNLFFDGEKLLATYKNGWYKLSKLPKKVEKKGADTYTNKRYELKTGFPVSELTPSLITYDDWDSESEVAGLYAYKHDVVEGTLEPIDFDIETLSEEEGFYIEKPKYPSTPNLMLALTTHPTLHTERPCHLTGKEFYKIIRNHVKLNINPVYAKISSDYDFCFTVEKVIIHEPISYLVDVGTKRKPRKETRYRKQRTVKVFETSPEGYSNYPKQEGIQGENQKDLEEKIDKYLEDLMTLINKPYVECTCCGGLGVVLDSDNK
jgi:hypothetical protein